MKHTKRRLVFILIMSAVTVCIPAGAVVTSVSAGGGQTVALMSDGTIWEWGSGCFGQLGDGTTIDGLYPAQLAGMSGITSISAGIDQTVVLDSSGNVWDWGWNVHGQIGNGTTGGEQTTPFQVASISNVKAISSGYGFTLALTNDGSLWGWGYNQYGPIGPGSAEYPSPNDCPNPVPVGLTNVVSISAGYYSACAVDTPGAVWTWGVSVWSDSTGVEGEPTTVLTSPRQVTGLPPASAVSVGMYHTVVLDTAGNVWTWGLNTHGQLGDGATNTNYTPEQVLSGVKAISDRRLSYDRAQGRRHPLGMGL